MDMTLIVPFVAIIIAVLAVGGLWLWWTSDEDDYQAPDRAQSEDNAQVQAAAQTIPAQQHSPPSQPPAVDGDAVEVLRLLRDLADGTLIVEINGQRYRRLADITDARVGRRFIGNARALARFARLGDVNVPDDWEQTSSAPAQPSVPPVSPPPEPAPPAPKPEPRQPAATEPEPAASSPGLFNLGGGDEDEEEPARPLTMGEQIEEMLQERLENSQEFAGQSIHIHSTMSGGIRIEINGTYYEAISEVPSGPELEFIRATIRAWEEQQ